jgi:hypothetical protein
LNRVEYPIYHDDPECEMPKALADKKIASLRDEQFVCGPIISKPDLTVLTATTGEVATLRCDVSKLRIKSFVNYFYQINKTFYTIDNITID